MPEEPNPTPDSVPESAPVPHPEPTAAASPDAPIDLIADSIADPETPEPGDATDLSSPPESVDVAASDLEPEAAAAEDVPAPLADAVLAYPAEEPAAELTVEEQEASPAVEPPSETWTDDIDSSVDVEAAAVTEAALPSEDWGEGVDWQEPPTRSPQPPSSISTREALSWLQPIVRRGLALWRQLLTGIRTRIPGTAKLPDRVLSGIVLAGLTVLLLLINNARQPDTVTVDPGFSEPLQAADAPDQSPALAAEPDPEEQARREDIAAKLAAGSLDEGVGLVEATESDFTHDRLTASLSDRWYELTAADQQAIAETLMKKSLYLSFAELELRSLQGDLLARSPVVGESMVILQRQRLP